ncbi:hypothetical protein Ahy_A04g017237 isoform D [Arachis hypogaea]|uniref:Glucose-6-phosphate dehydrogenase NAD-binding domain-containing protein n=1 Tax=Arachis hypogaea TaxID=3818 RepID=A0A445DAD2_ARAHY|nr:hypothetical protein Ahy_A04g017237 isoform D [Arachis hypogaea]
MATICSTHCRSYPSLQPVSSPSSKLGHVPQHVTLSSSASKRFLAAKVSLKSQSDSNEVAVHTHQPQQSDGAATAAAVPVDIDTTQKLLNSELLSFTSAEESRAEASSYNNGNESVSITVVGASGDLAKKKIFPALFALYYEDCLPKHFTIFGYARSKMTDAELRTMVSKTLTCRIDKRENCGEKMDEFLKRCFYHSGQYDSQENFAALDKKLKEHENGKASNRLFYLSIPPNIFIDAVKCASSSASSGNGWTRVIVEKPFGRDSESSAALTKSLKQYLREDQIFRFST